MVYRSTALLTIYDKNSAPDYVKTAAKSDRVLYIDKEQDLRGTPAHQLRNSITDSALKKNLAHFNRKVNEFKSANKIDDEKAVAQRVESGQYNDNDSELNDPPKMVYRSTEKLDFDETLGLQNPKGETIGIYSNIVEQSLNQSFLKLKARKKEH